MGWLTGEASSSSQAGVGTQLLDERYGHLRERRLLYDHGRLGSPIRRNFVQREPIILLNNQREGIRLMRSVCLVRAYIYPLQGTAW